MMFKEIKEQIKAIDERRYKDIKASSQTLKYIQRVFRQRNEIDRELLQTYIKLFIIDNNDTFLISYRDINEFDIVKVKEFKDMYDIAVNNVRLIDHNGRTIAIFAQYENENEADKNNLEFCTLKSEYALAFPKFYLFDIDNILHNKDLLRNLPYITLFDDEELTDMFINDDVSELSKYIAIDDHKTTLYTTRILSNFPLIGYAEMYGSVKCFKLLYLNGYFNIYPKDEKCIIIGNNYEILHICENEGINFLTMLKYAIRYHRNELIEYCYRKVNLTEFYYMKLIITCLKYFNYEALEFLLEHETYKPKLQTINNYEQILNSFPAIELMITKYNYILFNNFNGIIYEIILHGYDERIIKFIFDNKLPLDKFNYVYMIMKEAIRQNKNIELFKLLLQGLFGVSNLWDDYDTYVLIDPLTTFARNSYKLETFDINILKLLIARKSINNANEKSGENILFNLTEAYYTAQHDNIIELIKYLIDIGVDYTKTNNKGENILDYYLNKYYNDVSDNNKFMQLCKSLGLHENKQQK